jgi:hypothetical protein
VPVIPALRRLRRDLEFQAGLSYIVRLYLKKKKFKNCPSGNYLALLE